MENCGDCMEGKMQKYCGKERLRDLIINKLKTIKLNGVSLKKLEDYLYYEEKNPDLKIYCVDCLEILPLLPKVDLVVTSPPYDNLRKYEGFTFDFKKTADFLYQVIAQGGVLVWVVGDMTKNGSESGTSMRQAIYFQDIGFNLHDTMIYKKPSASFPETTRYYQVFEYMYVFSKGTPKSINLLADKKNKWAGSCSFGKSSFRQPDGSLKTKEKIHVKEMGIRNNVWEYATGYGYSAEEDFAFEHPAIFPEKLAQDHILSWSNQGDTVLDIFGGSGTTAKMCKVNLRNCIHLDVSEKYCAIAKQRLKATTKSLF
jgi:site-specific DNA-methyltransferase (adenine-specific)